MSPALETEGVRYFPPATLRAQIRACMVAWGMPAEDAEQTAELMVDADECGIDTHGTALLTTYDEQQRIGLLNMTPEIRVVRETPVSALVDADGSLGYVPSLHATRLAITKARESGIAAISVRNSGHFGAAGYYTRMMAAEGLVGLAVTSGSGPRAAPTFGREPKLSTNPIAFAAPAARNPAFSLDMATTTVAGGKIRIRANERMQLPEGWALDLEGEPLTDAYTYWYGEGGMLTPLGGSPEGASFKGYGLGTMVEILSSALSGTSLVMAPGHGRATKGGQPDVSHFFLALDPTLYRDEGEFETSVDELIDHLHATEPADPAQPVMVAGEPENLERARRAETGIPLPPGLLERIRTIAADAGVDYLLD